MEFRRTKTATRVMATLVFLVSCPCLFAQTMKVLVHMTDEQETYLSTEVFPLFEKENAVTIHCENFDSFDEIAAKLDQFKDSVGLVKVPFVKEWELVDKGYILSLSSLLSASDMFDFRKTYACWWLGARDNQVYFIPRKFETRIMAYRPSKVAWALDNWKKYAPAIDSLLSKVNGRGLPARYVLKTDPEQWDFFDVFVAGYAWSRGEFLGVKKPRIAHRGKLYDGAALRLVDRVHECGGDSYSLFNMNGKAVLDSYLWEAVYAWGGIYDSLMWTDHWTGQRLWDAFLSGAIFLSFFTQLDCISVLNKEVGPENMQKDAAIDFATSLMPRGCSVELDKKKDPLRWGVHRVTTGGWLWGVPKHYKDPAMAFKLARFITNRENQIKECAKFGMVPVRYDVIKDPMALFKGGPIRDVFATSYEQIQANNDFVLPSGAAMDTITQCYLDAWKNIVIEKNWAQGPGKAPNGRFLASLLEKNYAGRISRMMQGGK